MVLDIAPVLHRLAGKALADEYYEGVFEDLCDALVEAGLPLLRALLSMQILHPLAASVDITWERGAGIAVNPREFGPPPEMWLRSPLFWMLENEVGEMRRDLRDDVVVRSFSVFEDLRSLGATDYLALLTPFGDPDTAFQRAAGILTSWTSDASNGFTDDQVEALRYLQPYVGLVAKLSKHDYTTRNVVSAYLGEDVGRRVLEGQIRLGDVEHIPAVIWYSDLRDSTAMAERLSPATFLQTVNDYFDCAATAVLEQGGEVLRFIGDAVLAVFPITQSNLPTDAAHQAMTASGEARQRMNALNSRRAENGREPLAFGLGLHVGELLYGNIGVPTRIEFSVVGRAANEVARLESLTKEVGEPVLVSRAFKDLLDLRWRALGAYEAKGVGDKLAIYAPPVSSESGE